MGKCPKLGTCVVNLLNIWIIKWTHTSQLWQKVCVVLPEKESNMGSIIIAMRFRAGSRNSFSKLGHVIKHGHSCSQWNGVMRGIPIWINMITSIIAISQIYIFQHMYEWIYELTGFFILEFLCVKPVKWIIINLFESGF